MEEQEGLSLGSASLKWLVQEARRYIGSAFYDRNYCRLELLTGQVEVQQMRSTSVRWMMPRSLRRIDCFMITFAGRLHGGYAEVRRGDRGRTVNCTYN